MGLEHAVPNADFTRSVRVQCLVAAIPYQLPDIEVPDEMEVVVKNDPRNVAAPVATIIQVAQDRPSSINVDASWPLIINESIGYRIKNAKELYVSSNVAAQFVDVTVEQRKKIYG